MSKFPIGGSRQNVYNYLAQRGFMMSHWSDKHWTRADGIKLHVYGTGSMARIYGSDGNLIADDAIESAMKALDAQ